jgi:hypothetical protein
MGENAGNSKYNALQTELRMQATKGLTLQVAYTYSKAYDDTAGSANGGNGGDQDTIENPYNLAYDYGISTYNRTNIFLVDYVYNLPFFKDTSNKALHTMLGGWVLSGIVTAESGLPNNVTMSGATLGMSNYTNRPNEVAGVTQPRCVLLQHVSLRNYNLRLRQRAEKRSNWAGPHQLRHFPVQGLLRHQVV